MVRETGEVKLQARYGQGLALLIIERPMPLTSTSDRMLSR